MKKNKKESFRNGVIMTIRFFVFLFIANAVGQVVLPLISQDANAKYISEYSRKDYLKRWSSIGGGLTVRDAVLIQENIGKLKIGGCSGGRGISGKWRDLYTGEVFYCSSDLEVDHFIPLKEAHYSGAYNWDAQKKQDFANDLSNKDTLIAVSSEANRSKGASDPVNWTPKYSPYRCEYIDRWVEVKGFWGLTMDEKERKFISEELKKCAMGHFLH